MWTSRTWFGFFQSSEKSCAFKCKGHSVWSASLMWGTSGCSRQWLPRWVMMNKTIHPSPPKRRGAINLKDLKIYSEMANNEKNYIAQELKGDTSDEVLWQDGRKVDNWGQGPCRSCVVRSRFKPETFPSPTAVWLWAGFSTSLFLGFHIYIMEITGLPIKGCLCTWQWLSANSGPDRTMNEVMNVHIRDEYRTCTWCNLATKFKKRF